MTAAAKPSSSPAGVVAPQSSAEELLHVALKIVRRPAGRFPVFADFVTNVARSRLLNTLVPLVPKIR